MKKVIVLEFHLKEPRDTCELLQRVALACVDAKALSPGDIVRNAEEGVGYEVQNPTGLSKEN